MGGNGSYSEEFDGVNSKDRTHFDTEYRVEGHKVVVLQDNPGHDKIILNSNSDSPIYLFASVDGNSNVLTISGIGIYEKHKLVESIDLKFDANGDYLPYNEAENGSHSHKWGEVAPGIIGRKSHDKNNHLPIRPDCQQLIEKIVKFNKSGKIWRKNRE